MVAILMVGFALAAVGCKREVQPQPVVTGPVTTRQASPSAPAPAPPARAMDVTPGPATHARIEASIAWLDQQLRPTIVADDNPWVLAHGLLAFGRELTLRDGRSAVAVAASFAEPHAVGGKLRYSFPALQGQTPIEPHPYLVVKTFLQIGVPQSQAFNASDGKSITLRRLLDDMRATAQAPTEEAAWQQSSWQIEASVLARANGAQHFTRAEDALHVALIAKLEAEDSVIVVPAQGDPFAPDQPMGAAKRQKAKIYGYPCGGLHFMQAALRVVAASGDGALAARLQHQLELLLVRHAAERTLYNETLALHPQVGEIILGQQLKFYGHMLETLALAQQLGIVDAKSELAAKISAARRNIAADLLVVIDALNTTGVYTRLPELSATRHQFYLDLLGDGCHAIHGLRETLDAL